ncbi:hypothetical protein CPC08DRAFT_37716 [Agrocybe pediades]|nr:hypothetical protein CPC08DRAFT_37716 [Agrocybe pediades]
MDETYRNNELLLKMLGQNLNTDDVSNYAPAAERLEHWLSDSRAYYDSARPMTAYRSLLLKLGTSFNRQLPLKASDYPNHPHQPLIKAYVSLIESVRPFHSMFTTDKALYVELQKLLQTATTDSKPQHVAPDLDVVMGAVNETQPASATFQTTAETAANTPSTSSVSIGKVKKRRKPNFERLVQRDLKGLMQKRGSQPPETPELRSPSFDLERKESSIISDSGIDPVHPVVEKEHREAETRQEEQKEKEMQWNQWVDEISKPFDIPLIFPDASTVSTALNAESGQM